MNTKTYTMGLDLGDRRSTYSLLDANGKTVAEEAVATSRECFQALSKRYPQAVIAMETGTHSPWVSRLFEAEGHQVYVANARKLRAISSSNTKSDLEDARMLARLARVDPNPTLLSPVKHRSEAGQRAILQIKVREALVRSRVNLMNSVRFLLKSLSLPMPSGVKASSFVKKVRAVLDTSTCALVEPLLKMLEALNERINACEKKLEEIAAEFYPQSDRLQQVPGVGPLTALCFVAILETPDRFKHARDVGAYLGLVPRRDQSGTCGSSQHERRATAVLNHELQNYSAAISIIVIAIENRNNDMLCALNHVRNLMEPSVGQKNANASRVGGYYKLAGHGRR